MVENNPENLRRWVADPHNVNVQTNSYGETINVVEVG